MRFRDGVLDVVAIFLTLALSVSCTGTWFNWRRNFKRSAQNSQNRLHLWQKIQWKFWINCDFKSAFGVADVRQFPTTSKTPSLTRIVSQGNDIK